ncbi:MAG: DNA-3-methyladenine glycosylase, partial [Gaiellaceae bacterium]|nr:DNA-3-methyladenine glycosylase [Gaiellaceae bacterium]
RGATPLHELFWQHRPAEHQEPAGPGDWAASTPESAALAKVLRSAGFRFVGPTTLYAAQQACGVVNDHLADCWVREAVEAERLRFSA